MPPKSWRKSLSVIDRLLENPSDFSFIQALRLLERASVLENYSQDSKVNEDHLETKESKTEITDESDPNNLKQKKFLYREQRRDASFPVARFAPPNKEVVRIGGVHSLSFPANEIRSIEKINSDKPNETQWKMVVNFIGLVGAMGVLPYHYTEMILKRLKARDKTMSEFLNIFNHRTISLFYQASNKYRLPIEYERSKLHQDKTGSESNHTKALLGLLGLGANNLQNRQTIQDESIIFYGGLYSQQIKTASGLSQIIKNHFDVPVKIESFVGQWQELIDDVRTRLPSKYNKKGQNVCLGKSSMLGRRGWFAQGKVKLKLGPLNREQFDMFSPGTGSLKALNELVRGYVGLEQDYDCVIQVKRDDVPKRISLQKDNAPLLAWNTWLSGRPKTNTAKDEILEIVMSSKRLN